MTDPFSVVTGVVGIVGVALSNTRQVYDFISGIKGAPETVATLSGDLDSLANILQQLSDLTKDSSRSLFVVPLKGSLERCIAALEQLELSIKPYVEGLQNGKSKWKRFAWNFKEKEITALQVRLGSCRDNLQLAILLGVMMQQASGSEDIRVNFQKLQRKAEGDRWSVTGSAVPSSGPQGSDYGYALKRFLLEHESELGSQLGDDQILEEAVNEPSAFPALDPQKILQATDDYDMPRRQRFDAETSKTTYISENHGDLAFATQIGATSQNKIQSKLAGETASPLQHPSTSNHDVSVDERNFIQRSEPPEQYGRSPTSRRLMPLPFDTQVESRQKSFLFNSVERQTPFPFRFGGRATAYSPPPPGIADTRSENCLGEEKIKQEILADGWLEGRDPDKLTEEDQDELSERIAQAYRQRHPIENQATAPTGSRELSADKLQIQQNHLYSVDQYRFIRSFCRKHGRAGDEILYDFFQNLDYTEEKLQIFANLVFFRGMNAMSMQDETYLFLRKQLKSLRSQPEKIDSMFENGEFLPIEWTERMIRLHEKMGRN